MLSKVKIFPAIEFMFSQCPHRQMGLENPISLFRIPNAKQPQTPPITYWRRPCLVAKPPKSPRTPAQWSSTSMQWVLKPIFNQYNQPVKSSPCLLCFCPMCASVQGHYGSDVPSNTSSRFLLSFTYVCCCCFWTVGRIHFHSDLLR